MTRQEANQLLDRVRDGRFAPYFLIMQALAQTGDAPALTDCELLGICQGKPQGCPDCPTSV